jgi:hypothetical protein
MVRLPLILACLAILAQPAGAVARIRTIAPSRITETTPRLHFLYSYPVAAAAIPELAALLRKDGLESLAESRRDAAADGRGRRAGPDEVEQEWQVTANTRDLLALTAIASTYQDGSPHGYFRYLKLIWSRPARRMIELAELFSDRQKGVEQLMLQLCAKLHSERAARRLEEGGGRAMSMPCPSSEGVAIVPVAEPGGKIRSFRMMLTGDQTPDGYAGGSYEVETPVSPALAALVDPDLRESFLAQPQPQ